ncbi:hypothetical protein G436_1260 [Leptospira interrogans serovar Hardjo str. Norma]|uniref:Uncharacterized protein n=1 Tax=Leptospira interrogans serovar Hardjo str. Norma TaxID=1279460 RepID=A0A0M4N724_LEPIR|nr:hypothetical protein G436_1260 [Leptospira interrogans serovar Hardjo str. Norma]
MRKQLKRKRTQQKVFSNSAYRFYNKWKLKDEILYYVFFM